MEERPVATFGILMYNEQESITDMYNSLKNGLKAFPYSYEILYIDNGSNDSSSDIVKKLMENDETISLFRIENNQGYGNGIIEGLKMAKGEIIGYIWGDNQVDISDIIKVYEKAVANPDCLIKISRVMREDGGLRILGSYIYNKLYSILFSVRTKDANGCPKVFKKELFNSMALKKKDWLIDPELLYKAHRLGIRIIEIPIVFHKRKKGRSYVTLMTFASFFIKLMISYIKRDFNK